MDKIKTDQLMAARPAAYGWLGFQRFLLWVFLLLGILLMINTFFAMIWGFFEMMAIHEAARELAPQDQQIQHKINDAFIQLMEPIKLKYLVQSFFLSLCFFALARYAQKIINRNKYILALEEALQSEQRTF